MSPSTPPDPNGVPSRNRSDVPLVANIIDRLTIGGMENGLVNVINGTPEDRYRHAIICLRTDSDFRDRIRRDGVQIFALGKRAGKDVSIYGRVSRLLRQLRPQVVHTRNLPTVDMVAPAVLSGVPCRIHGEHGRDMVEVAGANRKYNLLRRLVSPWVDRYIAVSQDIESWLHKTIGVPSGKVVQIYNGVDGERFHPAADGRAAIPVDGFAPEGAFVIGTVGRMETVKDQLNLAHAFVRLVDQVADGRRTLRLMMIGDGTLRAEISGILAAAGIGHLAWLPGAREDVPDMLRAMDIFVLPSMNEGISNTILEAMACGRPVVATRVGGNPELVVAGETGALVPPQDAAALADTLADYVRDPGRIRRHGAAGRARIEQEFQLPVMVDRYLSVYDSVLAAKRIGRAVTSPADH